MKYTHSSGLLCILLALPAAAAAMPSLFLTQAEQTLQAGLNHQSLTLEALVYYAPNDWRLWLNGAAYTPQTPQHDGLSILAVTPHTVTVRQTLGSTSRTLTLAPQQRYEWQADRIMPQPLPTP
jgi:hypothetical protein